MHLSENSSSDHTDIWLRFAIVVVAIVTIGGSTFLFLEAPERQKLERFTDDEVRLFCTEDDWSGPRMTVMLYRSNQLHHKFILKNCNGFYTKITRAVAAVNDRKLWELHLNGVQVVRYERVRAQPVIFAVIAMFAYIVLFAAFSAVGRQQTNDNRLSLTARLFVAGTSSMIPIWFFSNHPFATVLTGGVVVCLTLFRFRRSREAYESDR